MKGEQETETVRGKSLVQLVSLFEEQAKYNSKVKEWAGLRRIGDDDGTAVWTQLTDPTRVKEEIERRARERREEESARHEMVMKALQPSEPVAENATKLRTASVSSLSKGWSMGCCLPSRARKAKEKNSSSSAGATQELQAEQAGGGTVMSGRL